MSWKRPPARPAKQFEGEIRAREPAPSVGLARMMNEAASEPVRDKPARIPATPSAIEARGRKIRESARGEACQIRIIDVCNHNPETTVWSHWPGLAGGRALGKKSIDLCGAYACSACHDVVDERVRAPSFMTREAVLVDWCEGHLRSLVILEKKGIV
jgi:hypothetical protein